MMVSVHENGKVRRSLHGEGIAIDGLENRRILASVTVELALFFVFPGHLTVIPEYRGRPKNVYQDAHKGRRKGPNGCPGLPAMRAKRGRRHHNRGHPVTQRKCWKQA